MVRLSFKRTLAPVLLLCAVVQAVPAVVPRQEVVETSTDLSTSTDDIPTATDSSALPAETGTEVSTSTDASPTDAAVTSSETTTDENSPTETDGSASITGTESSITGEATPSAWISVNETDGRISTIVPGVTTESDGMTRTVNLPDPNHTGPAESEDGEPASFLPTCDESRYQGGGKYAPFCLPNNETNLYLGETYYVTWNPLYWGEDGGNNTVEIVANYQADPDFPERGRVAFDSGITLNKLGFITFYVDPEKYSAGAIVHWTMKRIGALANTEKSFRSGPWVMISKEPIHHPQPSVRPPVSTVGLAVGLPLAVLFIVAVIAGLHFCNKDKRSIGGIVIPSMRRRRAEGGYVSRRARGQRANRAPGYRDEIDTKAAAWEMGAMRSPDTPRNTGPYQDEPTSPPTIKARSAESLPGNPFSDRFQEQAPR
ncbi:hypothetical protein TWF225_000862 [Orbilia oligospora]|uniref:Mid2 domain-containing protein n=1 Tax=Orbilia oligospora TaxID=2813651 RepID=A0A8H2HND6_ORBOL|nr:hypothetical protein TWF225_000862 [Orbilia oligospora]KAF3239146.1 hypothetical protein TWF128_011853 [Orbilia oligospora]KAF3246036.1 hypothetical protein TWF217_010018 [Orbilia oligospora]KAF3284398.1 hypothetical protein TWF132_009825 [Orbilia oligospora]TGJ65326.1 hypothetical protein EYR41_009302 [Orbilia oligospora]